MSDHLIHATLRGYDGVQYKLVCSDPDNCEETFDLGDWPDKTTCRCEDAECACRGGHHDECWTYEFYIGDVGTACLCVPTPGCGLVDWLNELGEEALGSWDGPTVTIPVKANWGDGDGPVFDVVGHEESEIGETE